MPDRNLTDDDVRAIALALADEMEVRLVKRFYVNIGKGVFGFFWKGVVTVLLIVAGYGAMQKWWN